MKTVFSTIAGQYVMDAIESYEILIDELYLTNSDELRMQLLKEIHVKLEKWSRHEEKR